jgi:uncharacterized delta-60 repeat protein
VKPRLEALEDRFLLSGNPGFPGDPPLTTLNLSEYTSGSTGLFNIHSLVQPDGKILVGGTMRGNLYVSQMPLAGPGQVFGAIYRNQIELARFNPDGTLDTSFGDGGVIDYLGDPSDNFSNFTLQSDGKIVVVGTRIMFSGTDQQLPGYYQQIHDLGAYGNEYASPDYEFVWQDSGMLVVRLNADGSYDSSFNSSSAADTPGFQVTSLTPIPGGTYIGQSNSLVAVTVQSDGKIVVAGRDGMFGNSPVVVVRYNADGSLDTSFNSAGTQPGVEITNLPGDLYTDIGGVASVSVDSDGRIIVGASETAAVFPQPITLTVPTLPNPLPPIFWSGESGGTLMSPGSIEVANPASTPSETDSSNQPTGEFVVLRYDSDGTLDSSFGSEGIATYSSGSGTNPIMTGLQVLPDGGILAAGYDEDSQSGLLLVRFAADGSLDTNFGQQGAVLLGTAANPLGPLPIVGQMYTPTGILPDVYTTNLIWTGTDGLCVQPDGNIIVSGSPSTGPRGLGLSKWAVASLNPDGSLNRSFGINGIQLVNIGPDITSGVALAPASDGSFIALGLDSGNLFQGQQTFSFFQYFDPAPPASPASGATPATAAAPASGHDTRQGTAVGNSKVSDAAFASIATGPGQPTLVAIPSEHSVAQATPLNSTTLTALLPIESESQSEQVARLSGGGDEKITSEDGFGLLTTPTDWDSPVNMTVTVVADAGQ